jgi:hypothetical protein
MKYSFLPATSWGETRFQGRIYATIGFHCCPVNSLSLREHPNVHHAVTPVHVLRVRMVCIMVFMQHVANNPDKVNGTAVIGFTGRSLQKGMPVQDFRAVFPTQC